MLRMLTDEEVMGNEIKYKEIININLEYSDKNYCIIFPKTLKDICEEAENQQNALKFYIPLILDSEIIVVFMRSVNNINKNLISIGMVGDDIAIARGDMNRNLSNIEMIFLQKYADQKNLNIDISDK